MNKYFLTICAIFVLLFLNSRVFASSPNSEIGRYQIYMNPLAAKFQYLVDTKTGKTWVLVNNKEGNFIWESISTSN